MKIPRILLVEGDLDSGEAIRMLLEMDGFDLYLASSGREAIEVFERTHATESRPDVVLLDLMLPDMDGVEVMRRLSEIATPPPLIIHSAAPLSAIQAAAEHLGAVGVLRKPTPGSVLTQALRALLAQIHARVA